jgi:N-acetylmuramoyl-L-alanine amidase
MPGKYTIEAVDGNYYQIDSTQFTQLPGVDLAIVKFTSKIKYNVAELQTSGISQGSEVHIVGWADPSESNPERGHQYAHGYISQIVNKPINGYALIYNTASTRHGTSGAPILDENGRIIGIHGRAYTDLIIGSSEFAGIPITTYQKFASIISSVKPVAQIVAADPPQTRSGVQPPSENPNSISALPDVIRQKTLVVIDPGHGGKDRGSVGLYGVQEVDVTLDISRQLASILERQGIKFILTRSRDDEYVGLDERVNIAQQAKGTIFVSIHANTIDGRPDINGLEVYHDNLGQSLAENVHGATLNYVYDNGFYLGDRSVRSARFLVLRKSSIPAILVETGYLTNEAEVRRLLKPDYRRVMAEGIARGIIQYLRERE